MVEQDVIEEHCLEETLPPEACCEAKKAGKSGTGLENACAEVTVEPVMRLLPF